MKCVVVKKAGLPVVDYLFHSFCLLLCLFYVLTSFIIGIVAQSRACGLSASVCDL